MNNPNPKEPEEVNSFENFKSFVAAVIAVPRSAITEPIGENYVPLEEEGKDSLENDSPKTGDEPEPAK